MTLNKIINHKGDVIDAALSGEYDAFIHVANCLNIMNAGLHYRLEKESLSYIRQIVSFILKKNIG
jgi:hypothetical protein